MSQSMFKALESVRCGLGGYLRLYQMASLLPPILLSAGWFVSTIDFYYSLHESHDAS